MLSWFIAASPVSIPTPPNTSPELLSTREQIVTALLRIAAIVSTLALIATAPQSIALGQYGLVTGYLMAISLTWALALHRQLDFRLRGGLILGSTYLLALNELLHFGYSVDAVIYLAGFALLPLAFLGWRAGVAALAASIATLVGVGWAMLGAPSPAIGSASTITPPVIVSACLSFAMIVGSVQAGMSALLRSLEVAWAQERTAREQLERAHNQLEQRVAERTSALADAHDAMLTASQTIAAQNHYLNMLHETTLDLLNHRALPDLLQAIVDRAANILEAPYGELMTYEEEALVVQAFTANQPFLRGDRSPRGEAQLSWRAFDTKEPVVIADYTEWSARRQIYSEVPLTAIADFPILVSGSAIGVLALGRGAAGQPFAPMEVQQGQLFAQMIGLVLENARLYDLAISEVAERRQAEQSLRSQTELLNAQNAELDAFAHTVAHDLTTPLAGLIGYADLLQLSVNSGRLDDLAQYAEIVTHSGRKMVRIINELLLLARVRKQADVPRDRLSMGAIVLESKQRLAHQIATAQATISWPEDWPAALGYAPWVEEVWTNYISNALKYGGRRPHITLGAEAGAPGFVRFWVRDQGQGLSVSQQEQLFAAFTQLHLIRAEGHGLGLSIVQRIVAKLGGEVGVESAPGQGSRFFFTLPAAPGQAIAEGGSAAHAMG